jgi:hypothetical protein
MLPKKLISFGFYQKGYFQAKIMKISFQAALAAKVEDFLHCFFVSFLQRKK